jgi:hydrogenase nickel incorporation protein HypA/HybF
VHEAGLAVRFVEAALEEAAARGASRVTAVGARIGELHGVVDRHLEGFFAVMARLTPAEGARLVIERVAARSACPGCSESFPGQPYGRTCPACGRGRLETAAGLEMELVWIEIE